MKRKIFSVLLAAICAAGISTSLAACGESEGYFEYRLSNDGTYYTISGKDNITATELVIPETYNGLPVKHIGEWAFLNCTTLESVTLPEGITFIAYGAFSNCTSLTSINIPDGVTTIFNSAFYNCNFTSLTLPDSVTEIGDGAFSDCSALESINIPSGVSGVSGVSGNTFSGCASLASITLPDSVTKIGNMAFYGCAALAEITIPEGVTSIGCRAFEGCASLESAVFENAGGWYAGALDSASGTDLILTDASLNAVYLTETYNGQYLYWYRNQT